MAIVNDAIKDMEKDKFIESPTRPGKPAIEVVGSSWSSASSGSILSGVVYDEMQATYPTTTQEVYVYKASTITVATITVDYTDTTKCFIHSVVKT